AVCWGSIVLVGNKLGGDAYSQTLGTTVGALIFSIVIYFFTTPSLSLSIFIIGMSSGFLWSIGQRNQFSAVKY
uniref:GRP family sugar transporter n=1 Tax=Cohnella sp. REN36 TaxID=2887347 RepID=UPI001D14482C